MKIGINLLLWSGDVTDEKFLPLLGRLKEMGFDGVELPIFDMQPKKFAALGRRLDDLGLARTAVTVRNINDNPIGADPKSRAAAVQNSKLALECCQASGATHLVGPLYAALGVFSGEGPTADEWRWGVETMSAIADHAETYKVTLGLEFLNRFEIYLLNTAADATRFVRDVNKPRCKMMYDTFHANIEEKNISVAIETCAPELAHVHISENDRSTPGKGQVNWTETFATLKKIHYDGWLTIEAFGLALKELAAATKIWRRMYVDEETLAREGLAFIKRSWNDAA